LLTVSGCRRRCHSGYVLQRPVGIAAKMVALVEADYRFLAAVGIVVIAAAVAVVYYFHTTNMGEMTPIAIAAAARGVRERGIFQCHFRRGGRGGVYSLSHCHCGGDDTNRCRCRCKGGSGMMLPAIASAVKVIAGRVILCRPLFNFFDMSLFFFFIDVGLLIFLSRSSHC
jgi:hypothetical protein